MIISVRRPEWLVGDFDVCEVEGKFSLGVCVQSLIIFTTNTIQNSMKQNI